MNDVEVTTRTSTCSAAELLAISAAQRVAFAASPLPLLAGPHSCKCLAGCVQLVHTGPLVHTLTSVLLCAAGGRRTMMASIRAATPWPV